MEFFNDRFQSLQPRESESQFPVLSWKTDDCLLWQQMSNAPDGVILFKDLQVPNPNFGNLDTNPSVRLLAPIADIRTTFCNFYKNPQLREALNPLNPERGIYKNAAFWTENIDRKVMIDFSPQNLETLQRDYSELMLAHLGEPFLDIIGFYNAVNSCIIPRLLFLCEAVIKKGRSTGRDNDIRGIHHQLNYNFRMTNYFPCKANAMRCGEHRDFGTFTIIFQDKWTGGLEVNCNGDWVPVPAESEMVFMWDWSALIFSNGRIVPPSRRVVPVPVDTIKTTHLTPYRFEAAFHVAPDMDAFLRPILPNQDCAFDPSAMEDLTVQKLHDLIKLKVNEREGTLTEEERKDLKQKRRREQTQQTDESAVTQDDIMLEFLLGGCYAAKGN